MPPIYSGLMDMMRKYGTTPPPGKNAWDKNEAYCDGCNFRRPISDGYEFGVCKDCKKIRKQLRAYWDRTERLIKRWRDNWINGKSAGNTHPVTPLDPISDRELFPACPPPSGLKTYWDAVETAACAYYRVNK